jgi:hypothetical protein
MTAGYTRQSSGVIVTSATIQASHFNNEYNALESAFNATTGHNHDGTSGGGAPIPTTGYQNDSVTYAKIQNVSATDKVLGRSSSGAGDIEEITCTSAGRALIDDADAAAQRTTLGLGTAAVQNSGTFVQVANNLSDVTASTARTNLGLAIGTDVQAYDADLTALAGLATTGIMSRTGSGTVSTRSITGTSNLIIVTNGDGVSGDPTITVGSNVYQVGSTDVAVADGGTGSSTASGARANLGLAVGTDVQAYNADLAAVAGLASTGIIARTGSGTATTRTITGTANVITVTNGDGVSGNPTLNAGSNIYQLGGTDVAVADGGTGASTASGALSNLGVTGTQMIYVPATIMRPAVTSGCGTLATVATSAGCPDMQSLPFDPSSITYAEFEVAMPEKWNRGTITPKVIWGHGSTTVVFDVIWQMDAVAVGDGDALPSAPYGSAELVVATGGSTNTIFIDSIPALTVGGSPQSGDTVCFRIARVGSGGSDTLAVNARLLGVRLYYTSNAGNDA